VGQEEFYQIEVFFSINPKLLCLYDWIPAFAGMTELNRRECRVKSVFIGVYLRPF